MREQLNVLYDRAIALLHLWFPGQDPNVMLIVGGAGLAILLLVILNAASGNGSGTSSRYSRWHGPRGVADPRHGPRSMADPRNPFGWTNPNSPNNPVGFTNPNSPNNPNNPHRPGAHRPRHGG
jgi:hypothetical protein